MLGLEVPSRGLRTGEGHSCTSTMTQIRKKKKVEWSNGRPPSRRDPVKHHGAISGGGGQIWRMRLRWMHPRGEPHTPSKPRGA